MISNDFCVEPQDYSARRKRFQIKRLEVLMYIRDGLERRLSAINASISTLNQQIERDSV